MTTTHRAPRRRLTAAVVAVLVVGASAAGLGAISLASAAPVGEDSAGTSTCTTSSAGYCTINHGLGRPPEGVLVTLVEPYRGHVSWDQATSASFRLHVQRPFQNQPYAGPLTFSWRVWAAPDPAPTTTEPPTTPPATTDPPTTTPAPTTTAPTTTAPATTTPAPTTTAPVAGWPDGTNTGVPAGTALTAYSGPCTITAAGTVIDARDVAAACQALIIKATGVVVTRSNLPRVEQTEWSTTWSVDITDSRISSPTWSEGVLWGFRISAHRVNVTGGQHSFHCNSHCLLEDSWLHGQYNPSGGSFHTNAFLTNGGSDMLVRHNRLHCDSILNSTDGGCTADVSLFGDFEQVTRVTIENNLLMANNSSISYCAYGGQQPSKQYPTSTYIVYRNNTFERGANRLCGVYGAITSWNGSATGNVWTNNVWDSGEPVIP